ncbi:Huntingtin-interacting protein K [Echria macrotheca]|uniref:Huntingtin-interacting protein K n=1 Tax=Echria macrotheca TaxID=438768 RepID=A0AAJ0BEC3_9PEZI|nr:Huntingtin-interacting protein K [Echria macrotheca]
MAESRQPPNLTEGPSPANADLEDEVQPTAKSAEDRKAAAALSKLDTHGGDDDDDATPAREVDQEAVKNAMSALGGAASVKPGEEKKEVKKVKVDAADVALLVEELELSKAKATELLKAHDGDAVLAMKAYITPVF